MPRPHLTKDMLTTLGAGGSGPEIRALLKSAEQGKRRLLLRLLPTVAGQEGHPDAARAEDAYATLADLEGSAPEAVAAVIDHPATGGWLDHTIKALRSGGPADPGGLAAHAAAAALRAGADARFDLPVRDGGLVLPSLGRALLPGGTAVVDCAAGTVSAGASTVRLPGDPGRDSPGWEAVRAFVVPGPPALPIRFDDVDPFRLPGTATASGRPDLGPWRDLLAAGWDLIVERHPAVALDVAELITTVTPMQAPPGAQVSSTSVPAFGAIGMSTPRDRDFAAVTFAHETQHTKLSALMGLVRLIEPGDHGLHYAPWRDDPRPVEGLLQGVHAFLGVTAFWRIERNREPDGGDAAARAEFAHTEFARWREGAALVAGTLLGSGALTTEGTLLLESMSTTLNSWRDEHVPRTALDRAGSAARRHREAWRHRNGRA